MSNYWEKMREYEQDGFQLIVSRHYDDSNPAEHFDCFDTEEQAEEFFRKIETGFYDWFGFMVQVFKHGVLLGESSLWGCCYEKAEEIFTDGTCDDIAWDAIQTAKETLQRIVQGEEVNA
jgi:hypothetical protein